MYFTKIVIKNYKSYLDETPITTKKGVNIIVGENNSGKSALLEALSLTDNHYPHISLKSKPDRDSRINEKSMVAGKFIIKKDEIKEYYEKYGNNLPNLITSPNPIPADQFINRSIEHFKKCNNFTLQFSKEGNNKIISQFINTPWDTNITHPAKIFNSAIQGNDLILQSQGQGIVILNQTLSVNLLNHFRKRIYYFTAERYNIGIYGFSHEGFLANNAQNLPGVLHVLQSKNPAKFEKYINLVKDIFPFIKTIRTIPIENKQIEIKIWLVDPSTERDDLAISLEHSGTGIAQVLAMLYIIIESEYPMTILIDEPQSFLHPGAIRKLMNIFDHHPQHQYIITTHSPVVISAFENPHIILLQLKDNETVISTIDSSKINDIRMMFHTIGIKSSDIFGADNILWVEGKTEELCFPLIFNYMFKDTEYNLLSATQICAVQNTGDFDGKKADLVFDIYDKLCTGNRVFPPAFGFVFDREKKPDEKIEDIKRRSKNKAYFLPRRMYENYILHPEAIAFVINDRIKKAGEDSNISRDIISQWIKQNKKTDNSHKNKQDNSERDEWEKNADAAQLLSKLFSEMTHTKLSFNKVNDSFHITKWILENNPEFLKPLFDFLQPLIIK